MRIAYLTSQYPATSHTFIRREVAALRVLGLTVDTFSIRPPSPGELQAEEDQHEARNTYTLLSRPYRDFAIAHLTEFFARPGRYFKTFSLALRHRAPGLKSLFLALAHFAEAILLAAELRHRKITRLHNHFANSGATVGLLASRHAKTEWSFTIHGISEFDYPAGLLLAEKIAAARFVACVSYFGRAQAERLVDPHEWPKLQIVRCGLELDRLPAVGEPSAGEVRVIFVGRLSPEKGVTGLLDAMSTMQSDARPRLTLVGDGPLRPGLERQARELGLDAKVDFLGRLSEPETLAQIARSDILILPSFMEGLPIVLMEALALGVPVIASRVAGIPELVTDGATGLLFTPSNWDELATALGRLVGDDALRSRLGKAGPTRIADEFDVRKSAVRLRDLFQSHAPFEAIRTEHPISPGQGTSVSST